MVGVSKNTGTVLAAALPLILTSGAAMAEAGESSWERIRVDTLPKRSMFALPGDVDGDGKTDIVAGGWWWKNPGNLTARWQRFEIGEPLRNMAALHDFDGDGDVDVLGTQGVGSGSSHDFVWAMNDGQGRFTVLENIDTGGSGDFLQGCLVSDFGAGLQVVLSWHKNKEGEVQSLIVSPKPAEQRWAFKVLSPVTLHEDLDVGDIDRDGDLDILLGTIWLQNDGNGACTPFTLGEVPEGEPDRNDLADINGDGRLDAVVSLEKGTPVLWYEAPEDPRRPWRRHQVGLVAGQGFSMDVADMDRDGDPDIVVGEHRGQEVNRVVMFENLSGGDNWREHTLDAGPTTEIDHHDGTQIVDLDGDGELEILSVGWYNPKLWIFRQR